MKFTSHRILSSLHLRAVVGLAFIVTAVCAQSQPSPILLELKACGGELQLFADGTVISKTWGAKTERKLSVNELAKVRRIIAAGPCQKEIREQNANTPADKWYCMQQWQGMVEECTQEVVIRHYPDPMGEPFPVYLPHQKTKGKDKRDNPVWQRFLSDLTRVVGGKNIVWCKCKKRPPMKLPR